MNIIKRAIAPTPSFFKKIRTIGLVLAGIGGGLLASPVELPDSVSEVGGYMALIGGVISAMSQITVDESKVDQQEVESPIKLEANE